MESFIDFHEFVMESQLIWFFTLAGAQCARGLGSCAGIGSPSLGFSLKNDVQDAKMG